MNIPNGKTLVIVLGYDRTTLEQVISRTKSLLTASTIINVNELIERQALKDTPENRKKVFEIKLDELIKEDSEFFICTGFPTDIKTSTEIEEMFAFGHIVTFNGNCSVHSIHQRTPLTNDRRMIVKGEIEKYNKMIEPVRNHLSQRSRGYFNLAPARNEQVQATDIAYMTKRFLLPEENRHTQKVMAHS